MNRKEAAGKESWELSGTPRWSLSGLWSWWLWRSYSVGILERRVLGPQYRMKKATKILLPLPVPSTFRGCKTYSEAALAWHREPGTIPWVSSVLGNGYHFKDMIPIPVLQRRSFRKAVDLQTGCVGCARRVPGWIDTRVHKLCIRKRQAGGRFQAWNDGRKTLQIAQVDIICHPWNGEFEKNEARYSVFHTEWQGSGILLATAKVHSVLQTLSKLWLSLFCKSGYGTPEASVTARNQLLEVSLKQDSVNYVVTGDPPPPRDHLGTTYHRSPFMTLCNHLLKALSHWSLAVLSRVGKLWEWHPVMAFLRPLTGNFQILLQISMVSNNKGSQHHCRTCERCVQDPNECWRQ